MADEKDLQAAESLQLDTEPEETPEELEPTFARTERIHSWWLAGDRDSPAGAAIDADFQLDVTNTSNERLLALLQMDGLNGYDRHAILQRTGQDIKRPRRWSKFFERMGVMYRDGQITRLTELGQRLAGFVDANRQDFRKRLAGMALSVLSRYQLKNPADEINGQYPDDCDVFPYWCIWKVADALDGKIHWDELNREVMRVLRMRDLDACIDRLAAARADAGYDPSNGRSSNYELAPRCYDEDTPPPPKTRDGQVRDHYMTPWLKRAGFGGLLLSPSGKGGEGYWTIPDDLRPLLQAALKIVPSYRSFATKDQWFEYYGKLTEEPRTEASQLSLQDDDKVWVQTDSLLAAGSLAIVLTGPPGTSKTWYAKRIAAKIAGSPERVCFTQFHPSFSYDDFIEGYIPSAGSQRSLDGALFEIKPKIFLQLCEQARHAPDQRFVMVIDEINRGDVSRVLGELVTYIEPSYRDAPFTLAYSGKRTSIPPNIVFLGTMNPYDRSITEMDDALERRFQRILLPPETGILAKLLKEAGAPGELIAKVVKFFQRANELAPHGFGHAYFVGVCTESDLIQLWNHTLRFVFEKMFRFDTDKFADIRNAFAETVTDAAALA